MKYQKIENLAELKELAKNGVECFIWLGCRSSKFIQHDENGWVIYNEIDDSEDVFGADEEMLSETSIGRAIENGRLYKY